MSSTTISPEHGIYRGADDDAWYVKPISAGVSPKPFFDATYGDDPGQSYAHAFAFNRSLRPYEAGVRNVQRPRHNKFMADELPVGVSLCKVETPNKGGKGTQTVYNLRVSMMGLESNAKTIYVGTANTWERNLPGKIKKAIELRDKSKQQLLRRGH